MSETWSTSSGQGEWNANAPISSLSPARVTVPARIFYTETRNSDGFITGTNPFTVGTTLAQARERIARWNAASVIYTYAIVETPTATQPANGQKAISPMKLTFVRTALIGSLQSIITTATAKFDEAQSKFDAAKATATAVVDANLASIAVANGFKAEDADAFKKSNAYAYAVQGMQNSLGLPSVAPNKPNTKSTEALIATLSLATDTNLEIEEGHQFIAHLAR